MSDHKFKAQLIPPNCPGTYRIRDADGDIVYWGDSADLYQTWCEKVQSGLFNKNFVFEFMSTEPHNICRH